ncbi:hypothetical protein B566_EDAN006296 [Ephemera danica]|nr:hypothetical protein B566_EDAN006296 [Ephemera danica]
MSGRRSIHATARRTRFPLHPRAPASSKLRARLLACLLAARLSLASTILTAAARTKATARVHRGPSGVLDASIYCILYLAAGHPLHTLHRMIPRHPPPPQGYSGTVELAELVVGGASVPLELDDLASMCSESVVCVTFVFVFAIVLLLALRFLPRCTVGSSALMFIVGHASSLSLGARATWILEQCKATYSNLRLLRRSCVQWMRRRQPKMCTKKTLEDRIIHTGAPALCAHQCRMINRVYVVTKWVTFFEKKSCNIECITLHESFERTILNREALNGMRFVLSLYEKDVTKKLKLHSMENRSWRYVAYR